MLASHSVDALHCGQYATALAMTAHLCVLLLHIARLRLQHETANLEVGESRNLCLLKQGVGQFFERVILL